MFRAGIGLGCKDELKRTTKKLTHASSDAVGPDSSLDCSTPDRSDYLDCSAPDRMDSVLDCLDSVLDCLDSALACPADFRSSLHPDPIATSTPTPDSASTSTRAPKSKERQLRWDCHHCDTKFTSKKKLQSHQIENSDEKFCCRHCKKVINTYSSWKIHERGHTSDKKPEKCQMCNKMFISRDVLLKHLFVHTGEKQFVCEVCKKSYKLKSTLNNHERKHSGETPFECTFCKQRFGTGNAKKLHEKDHIRKIISDLFRRCKRTKKVKKVVTPLTETPESKNSTTK